jgi:crotonobetaine/carnitine-CoA ligase
MTALSPFNGMNLDRLLEARQRERPNHPFLIWAPFDGEVKIWTYRQFAIEAAQLAGASPRGASAR